MFEIKKITDFYSLYEYHTRINSPFIYKVEYNDYLISLLEDIDSEGNMLFKNLHTLGAYENDKLVGFIQYGISSIGFDESGNISKNINYQIIRQIYFDNLEIGNKLLNNALSYFNQSQTIYAFFHYFGMSCFARHGKLLYLDSIVESLLINNNFEVEHENVYYSIILNSSEPYNISLEHGNINDANKQLIVFKDNDTYLGECEIHYVNKEFVYLRWIYINNDIQHKGYGSKCLNALKSYLYNIGIKRLDTDTAINNTVAQSFYRKNGFINKGNTRSYYLKSKEKLC